ncbi:uncharacterized protein E5676_scaffold9G00060 [Cucumis melo var. makuwa]|uniref:Retrotransposon gag protein n=1 Tax=Cucumis melo var. makuwa TaxID=1194695 RepID=A0A5A7SRT4_CUCMM|nr:uncharacterized protein E6C27_scaffold845G00440 [Cucumis melo var. makuwa]TYK19601.1 uncharacterized protein E5676_scaffold9G00060 [Cucumis melo var. makuwa]
MTQLTTAISKMDGKGKLPAQLDHANVSVISLRSGKILEPPPPNRKRLAPKKKETPKEEELLEMFRKVQINLPLLDAIQQVPRYAKFLKELCTNKRKTKERAVEIG